MKRYLLLLLMLWTGCDRPHRNQTSAESSSIPSGIRYARGFKITPLGKVKKVEVTYPYQGATSGYTYLLVPKDEPVPDHDRDTRIIRTPVERVVCTSTTHIPLLDYLDETHSLVGFPTTDFISSEKMRKRIDAGAVTELGVDKGINLERLSMLKPDLLMGYTMSGDYGQFKKMEELGVPVVLNAEYLEKHPLGRAEWIKFMGLFFGKEKEADAVFARIEKDYLETLSLTNTLTDRPSVLSGIVYGDVWFMPGGENYAAKILKDAGCRYLWDDTDNHGFLELSFESVYQKAHQADLWIGVGSFSSLQEMENADHRYARFSPWINKQVYTYDARKGAKGGSEFLELGYLRPDLILKDLVKIAHPQVLPGHSLYFHRKLE